MHSLSPLPFNHTMHSISQAHFLAHDVSDVTFSFPSPFPLLPHRSLSSPSSFPLFFTLLFPFLQVSCLIPSLALCIVSSPAFVPLMSFLPFTRLSLSLPLFPSSSSNYLSFGPYAFFLLFPFIYPYASSSSQSWPSFPLLFFFFCSILIPLFFTYPSSILQCFRVLHYSSPFPFTRVLLYHT